MRAHVRACVRTCVRSCAKVQSHVIISCKLTKQLTQGKDILIMAMNDQSMSINALRDNYYMAVNTFQPLVAGRHASRVNKCVTVG